MGGEPMTAIDYPPRLKTRREQQLWIERVFTRTKETQKREKLVDCPYPSYEYDENVGKLETVQHECGVGPDPVNREWCKFLCPHYQKHLNTYKAASKKYYLQKKTKRLESYGKTGLAPWLRKKIDPSRVMNVINTGRFSTTKSIASESTKTDSQKT